MSRDPTTISLFLADVDGTLVTHEKVLTERTRRAVADLRAAGVRFAITSGRPPKGMEMVIRPLAIDTPIAGFNGGLFTDAAMTPIAERKVPADVAREVVAMIEAAGLDAWLYAGNDWLVHEMDAPHVAREQRTVQFPPQVVADYADRYDAAVKIVGVSDDPDAIHACAQAGARGLRRPRHRRAVAALLPRRDPSPGQQGRRGAGLSERLGIPVEEIATIGDSENDTSMFRKSGYAIAMGNADAETRAQADVVVADCDSEGFAEAVEAHILPQSERNALMPEAKRPRPRSRSARTRSRSPSASPTGSSRATRPRPGGSRSTFRAARRRSPSTNCWRPRPIAA